jgi:hypothetical protein
VPGEAKAPDLPAFYRRSQRADHGKEDMRTGFTLDLWVQLETASLGRPLLSNRTADGKGFALVSTVGGAIELILNDGRTESRWTSDPGTIQPGNLQHVVVVVDGGPKIITFVVDGILNDGGDARQFGWGRFNPNLRSVQGAPKFTIDNRAIKSLRVYDRILRTSEAIAAYRAGL